MGLAHLLEQATGRTGAEDVVEHRQREAVLVVHRRRSATPAPSWTSSPGVVRPPPRLAGIAGASRCGGDAPASSPKSGADLLDQLVVVDAAPQRSTTRLAGRYQLVEERRDVVAVERRDALDGPQHLAAERVLGEQRLEQLDTDARPRGRRPPRRAPRG